MKRLMPAVFFALVLAVTMLVPLSATGDEGRPEGTPTPDAPDLIEAPAPDETGAWDGDGPAPRDQVILDDLIVDGSICAGLDCVNGESFGFDTLRLKENNLRIRAFDTSATASFPTQDWQITFNDSANGGQNKFSIDAISPSSATILTLEAGAPSHSLYVDDGGRLGLGTNNPVVDVHVKSGNTPTLRLEQDGSSGFTPQTWDVAGNEANFFIRDATNGSTLPFRIEPGVPSNALYIENTGEVGIGTNNPEASLHIFKNVGGTTQARIANQDVSWRFGINNADQFNISLGGSGVNELVIDDGSGAVTIARVLNLTPQASPPAGAVDGSVYVDTSSAGTLCFRSGGVWSAVAGGGSCS